MRTRQQKKRFLRGSKRPGEHRGEFRFAIITVLLSLLVLLFQNCGKGFSPTADQSSLVPNPQNSPTPSPTPGPSGPPAFGLTTRKTLPALPFAQETNTGSTRSVGVAFPNLTFATPIFLTHSGDQTNRLFVVEQGGKIKVFSKTTPTSSKVFLDIGSKLSSSGGEEGLLGLAFPPDYKTSGVFYVYYTAPGPLRSVVARYRVSATDPDAANPNSEQILLTFNQPYSNHNGGCLAFGPDGMLYIASGDGGSGGDPQGNGQNLSTLLGKILRIDVSGGNASYAIPPDNPYANSTTNKKEIFAYGLRNPWRFSFDRNTGKLWAGDVGQNLTEEVDIIDLGDNMGWNSCEGSKVYGGSANCTTGKLPIVTYDHNQGQSITGGYVYRGTLVSSLTGSYIYGDFVSKKMWALKFIGSMFVSNLEIESMPDNLSSFGEDEIGELYMVGYGTGKIYKFSESGGTPTPVVPTLLSQTGLFTNLTNLTPVDGLIEYDVNVPLWSDNAKKRRWIGLPGQSKIQFDPSNPWTFPVGTIFVKHFEVPTSATTVKRLETRVLYNGNRGWAGYTYKWNSGGTDATLLPDTASENVNVYVGGSMISQVWTYPSRSQCMICHTQASGYALSVRTHQLNSDFNYSGIRDNQMRAWNHINLFTTNVPGPENLPSYPKWTDDSANLEQLSRAYLSVNCSQCHQPGGTAPVDIDFRYTTLLSLTNLIDVPPSRMPLGLPNEARIRRGAHLSSNVWMRMNQMDTNKMPPLGVSVKDTRALDIISRWIDSL